MLNAPIRLKITEIRLLRLRLIEDLGVIEPAWDVGGQMRFTRGGGAITEVHTDGGIVGIGPAVAEALLPRLRHHLVGKDPFAVEELTGVLHYYASDAPHYLGTAGVDIALWDIIGKACGQPLYKLWGGNRDKVPAYASMVRLSTPDERVAMAIRLAEEGWQAIKLRIHAATLAEDVELVSRVIDAVGDRMVVMVDANQAQSAGRWQPGVQWDARRALETARELDRLGVYLLEEPLPRYAFKDLAAINRQVAMPLAGGENNPGLHEFVQMVDQGVYDILQPESMVLGGITALRKVGVLGELHGMLVMPHHGGRGLGTIAHLHLTAAWAHAPYLELLHDPPIGEYEHGFAFLANPPVVDKSGFVATPQGPGLGVEIDRSLVIDE